MNLRPTRIAGPIGYIVLVITWAVPCGQFAYGRAGCGAAVGAIMGAAFAVTLGRWWARDMPTLWRQADRLARRADRPKVPLAVWRVLACALPMVLAVLGWLVACLPARLGFIPVLPALLIADAIHALVVAYFVVTLLGLLARSMPAWGRLIEWAGIAWLFADAWVMHRYGDMSRPHAFADFLALHGWAVESSYSLLALALLVVLFLYVLGEDCVAEKCSCWGSWLALAAAGVVVFVCVELWMPSPAIAARPPAPPPISFAADPPPPPPPEPEIVAVVELGKPLFVPWPSLGGYYFRTGTPGAPAEPARPAVDTESAQVPLASAHAAQPIVVPVRSSAPTPQLAPVALLPVNAAASSTITLLLRVRPERPWEVPGMVNSSTVPSSRADFPVREVLACKAAKDLDLRLVPTSLETPDALGAIAFGEEYWDDAARAASVPTSSDPRIPALLERILASLRQKWVAPAGKPGNDFALLRNAIGWAGRDADSFAAARVVAIREWLEASVIYDDRIPAPKDAVAVDDFLHGDLKGSDSHLARAAVLLLQAAGIPSRVAEGYLVPLEPQRPYQFTVMDVHGTEWAEIHVRGMGWMPLVIRPRQVISREPPPPAKTKQDDVLGKVNTPPPAAGTGTRARLMWFAVAALEAAATVVAGLIFVYMGRGLWVYRRRFVTGADEALIKHRPYLHRWLLAAAAELLGLAGFERRAYGVTWAEFAEGFEKFANSEGHKSRPLAKAFSDLVRFNALGEDGLLDEAAIAELIACYAGFRSALPATRFIKVIGQLKSFTTPTKPL